MDDCPHQVYDMCSRTLNELVSIKGLLAEISLLGESLGAARKEDEVRHNLKDIAKCSQLIGRIYDKIISDLLFSR